MFAFTGAARDLHSFPTRRSSDLQSRKKVLLGQGRYSTAIHSRVAGKSFFSGSMVTTYAPNAPMRRLDRKSTRLNSSHSQISYAVFCLKKKNQSLPIQPHGAAHAP